MKTSRRACLLCSSMRKFAQALTTSHVSLVTLLPSRPVTWPSPYLFVLQYTLHLPLFTLHPHPYLMCPGPQPPGGLHLLLSYPRAGSHL